MFSVRSVSLTFWSALTYFYLISGLKHSLSIMSQDSGEGYKELKKSEAGDLSMIPAWAIY